MVSCVYPTGVFWPPGHQTGQDPPRKHLPLPGLKVCTSTAGSGFFFPSLGNLSPQQVTTFTQRPGLTLAPMDERTPKLPSSSPTHRTVCDSGVAEGGRQGAGGRE